MNISTFATPYLLRDGYSLLAGYSGVILPTVYVLLLR